ncbi:seg-like homing endonuclease [Vibrio phage phi-Grn1]|uniref:Seg-like homing endonuclease n=1 Tax=Vibrio phage phi-Grn1 TaxID=1747713 RepID=A0A126HGT8_9CAUD|nr:seg-like homing endonuclease [Vibrio phage phi-Grn1]
MKEQEKNYNYIYKITNNINGHYYYGKRSCDCLPEEDSYMGSGVGLHRAYEKYGIENFTKEIVSLHDTHFEAYEEEARIVTENMINSKECYNMKTGGLYNSYTFTDDVKSKISDSMRQYALDNGYAERMREVQRLSQSTVSKMKRALACSKPRKYTNGKADTKDNHTAYMIWILRNTETGEEIVSYDGLGSLPINKGTVFSRMQRMGIKKDRTSHIVVSWGQGKNKHIEVERMSAVCWL